MPGIGALIAHHTPASVDEYGRLTPPSRHLAFNASITHTDGLIAASVARLEGIDIDSATARVSSMAGALKCQLEEQGEYAIGRLGTLRRNDDGTVSFEPFTGTSIAPAYMGLPELTISKIGLGTSESTSETAPKKVYYLPISRNIFKLAASVAALIGLGIMLTTPVVEHNVNYASIGSPVTAQAPAPDFTIADPAIELRIALPDPDTATAAYTPVEKPGPEAAKQPEQTAAHRYFLIVASLPDRAKAEEYISTNDTDNNMRILESDGRCRVYIATGATYAEAYNSISDTDRSTRYPDAWVCRR